MGQSQVGPSGSSHSQMETSLNRNNVRHGNSVLSTQPQPRFDLNGNPIALHPSKVIKFGKEPHQVTCAKCGASTLTRVEEVSCGPSAKVCCAIMTGLGPHCDNFIGVYEPITRGNGMPRRRPGYVYT